MKRKQILTQAQKKRKCYLARKRYAANPEKYRAYNRQSYQRHKTKRQHRDRVNSLRILYDLTEKKYDVLLKKQNGVCAVCGKSETVTHRGKLIRLAVDHDHITNKVRGLLCNKCNRMIENSRDNIETLKQGIRYLRGQK